MSPEDSLHVNYEWDSKGKNKLIPFLNPGESLIMSISKNGTRLPDGNGGYTHISPADFLIVLENRGRWKAGSVRIVNIMFNHNGEECSENLSIVGVEKETENLEAEE